VPVERDQLGRAVARELGGHDSGHSNLVGRGRPWGTPHDFRMRTIMCIALSRCRRSPRFIARWLRYRPGLGQR
jgi:hypothetical protein